jgi:putative ATP-binding cassette transporter
LIVTQFQQLSMYGAVLVRLGTFSEAVDRPSAPAPAPSVHGSGPEHVVYDDLSLRAAGSGDLLLAHLTLTIPNGTRLLVTGTEEARRALFRATALPRARDEVARHISVPGFQRILFLPERPYVPAGTLRELLVRTGHERELPDARIQAVLRDLGLEPTLRRQGGLDVERDWSHVLSLGEQQLLAVARVALAAPAFAVFQSPDTTLAPEQLARAFAVLTEASVTYLAFGGADAPPGAYDAVLELHAGGAWSIAHAREAPKSPPLSAPNWQAPPRTDPPV